MSREGSVIAARILGELKDLSALVERMEEGWKRAKRTNDDYYLDGVALNLHGFYSGLEPGKNRQFRGRIRSGWPQLAQRVA